MKTNSLSILMEYRRRVLKEQGKEWFHVFNEGLFGLRSESLKSGVS